MANRKEYEMLFQLSAQLGGSYNSTFKNAQASITSMQREIQALSKTQGDITAYQKQQTAVDATKKKMAVLQQQYDNIQREIKETEGFSSSLENKLLSKQQQIDKTAASIQKETEKLNQMGDALRSTGIDTGNLEQETARLGEEMDGLKAEQEQATDGAESFGVKSAHAFGAVQQAITAAGIAVALKEITEAYIECINVAGDFEYSMSNVEALSGAYDGEMEQLGEMAKELGATTKFTAKESADAMGYMAMAGWDASEMLDGMDSVLNLAAASGEDLAMVSDIVTDSLTAFGLQAADTGRFADVLAAAATKSNTNVSLMGETFKYVAPVAGALGYSIEDTAVAIGLMANSGIKGSRAGTALRAMMTNLTKPTEQVQEYIDALGISLTDASGTVKPFNRLMDEMRTQFARLTDAQKAEYAAGIAGAEGMSGMLAVVNASAKDYDALTDHINNSAGAAQHMAGIKMDNMVGELTIMQSAWEAVKTTIGEDLTPTMQDLYGVGGDLLTELNEFLAAHPGLVKGVAAFTAVIGGGVAALTAYAAITKVAIPLMGMFTAAIPGVNIIAGVTAGVAALAGGIAAMVSAAKEGIPTVEDLTSAASNMQDTMKDATASYEETATSTLAAAEVAASYIDRLDELGVYSKLTASEQTEYHNTLALLCQIVPELADQINLETNSIQGGTDALRANTDAWKKNAMQAAYQDQLNSLYASYSDVMIEAEKNSIGLTKSQGDLERASRKLNDSSARAAELYNKATIEAARWNSSQDTVTDTTDFLTQEYYDMQAAMAEANDEIRIAEGSIKNYKTAIDEGATAVAEAESEIALAEEAVRNLTDATDSGADATAEADAQQQALMGSVEAVVGQINTLAEAYGEAYTAAYDSVSGQYALWDQAAEVVATSAGTINSALESQASYWADYNENLQTLTDRSSDIEGLSDILATFADGSAESVNAIAGLAGASDADLQKMVQNWQTLQKEQETAAGSIADLKTDFSNTMDELQADLAADIEAMDLGTEAAQSGKATIQGFIDGAAAMQPLVASAYAEIAQAAITAIDQKLDIHSPSRVMAEKAEQTWAGYINQTEAMAPDVQDAMASTAGAGSDAVRAEPAIYNGGNVFTISLAPVYQMSTSNNSGEAPSFKYHDRELLDRLRDMLEEIRRDDNRRAYR